MFQNLNDFTASWKYEREATEKVLAALTDASLGQAINHDHRTIGRIAWHIIQTAPEMLEKTGLTVEGPPYESPAPTSAADILAAYRKTADSVESQIAAAWTDESLQVEDDMYGERWKRGYTLFCLIIHQSHHRGQLTVLMRQAGLPVPGVYGPAKEEWAGMGMAAPQV